MAVVTTRTCFCFCGWFLNVLVKLHPVGLENCVYFKVSVVPRAMYAIREAGDDTYVIPVSISIHLSFGFLRI
jgi:hypothetical protein